MLLIPPVILRQAPEPLPAHAHASLKEAKAASKASGHAIYAILAADDAGRDAALAFLGTPAANQARSHGEIWIPRIQDPEALRFRSERVTEPGTAVLLLDPLGDVVEGVVQGKEAVPIARAFRVFDEAGYDMNPDGKSFTLQPGPWAEDPKTGRMQSVRAPLPPSEASLRAWAGPGIDPKALQAFLKARKADPAAGAHEPHATWLRSVMASGSDAAKVWAATRLVEADPEIHPGPALDALLSFRAADLARTLGRERELPPRLPDPPEGVPEVGFLSDAAPAWAGLRKWLASGAPPDVSVGLYALLSRQLDAGDRAAVLSVFQANGARHPDLAPWNAPAFWLATDWLIAHGHAQDWPAFEAAAPSSWLATLKDLQASLAVISAYWQGREEAGPLLEISLQFDKAAAEAKEAAFWAHPSQAFQAWHISREALTGLHFGTLKRGGDPEVIHAAEAERRRIFGQVIVVMLVDPDGHVRAARVEPGYALGLLAPAALQWVCAGTFSPSAPEDRGKPWIFSEFLHLGRR